ncbi:MAG TPA: tetratricopeptide repeat protein, partial [Candidatus Acidoferrum sp.]|nr:tetratricopeptide repeat protein [Candidatus Acidoferrum sp.]
MTSRFKAFCPLILLACTAALGVGTEQQLQRKFQEAVQLYDSNRLDEAAVRLQQLVRESPQSFDVHELLGMVYSAQGKDAEATEYLQSAVRLKPNSSAARTNLAANLVRVHKLAPAEIEFKKALALDPASYDTNHNLGEFYIASGKVGQAIPLLGKAHRLKPNAYDNAYDLALACLETGKHAEAERVVQDLIAQKNTAELHNLLAEIEEKSGNFVAAEHEYESAAHMDPSEANLFDWASELLLHRTLDPAVEVFSEATQRYPKSPRLAIGLGMAFYSRGNYDDAVKALLKAADLDPADARSYYFLSKAYDSSPAQADEVIERFRKFAELQPRNGHSLYYYAMALWKGRRAQDASVDFTQIELLLKRAVELDPKFPEAHLQLGNLYSDQKKYPDAAPQYEQALALNSDLADAHYRLGQAYVHLGKRDEAQQQLQVYQKLRAEHLAELDRQRAEIR